MPPPAQEVEAIRLLEQMAQLEKRLPAVLEGKDQPKDAAECLALAQLCPTAKHERNAASARFFTEAFTRDPKLAEKLDIDYRLTAARVAALAGCGLGRDAAGLDEKERARLRRQALDWLRADLEARTRHLDESPGWVAADLRRWLVDPSFAGVRGPKAGARLPEAERQLWKKMWDDITATLARAEKGLKEQLESKKKPGAM
jgi:hypothetical protein